MCIRHLLCKKVFLYNDLRKILMNSNPTPEKVKSVLLCIKLKIQREINLGQILCQNLLGRMKNDDAKKARIRP